MTTEVQQTLKNYDPYDDINEVTSKEGKMLDLHSQAIAEIEKDRLEPKNRHNVTNEHKKHA